jgi:phosphate transport system permease protein
MPETRKTSALHTVPPIALRRRITDHVMTGAAVLTVILVLLPLFAIFAYLVYRGVGSLNWAFLTQTPKPVGEAGGGMANAIVGSAFILALASILGVPIGVGAGIYLAEFGRNRFGDIIRFTADVLNGVPSIVIGIVAYAIVVLSQKHFSALAGGVALAIMMIPTISRATEEMLLLVPQALREAAYGLGIPRWRTTLSITLRTATSGVITGVMLAFARVAGETAPLLFTTLGNQFWSLSTDLQSPWQFLLRHPFSFFWDHHMRLGLDQPTAALPLQIYAYALSPYDDWHRQAWAGALVLIVLIVSAVAAVRFAVRRGTFGAA